MITRSVQVREKDRPLISTPGSRYTVIIEGRVADANTGMTMPDATIMVVTATGSYEFWGGLFQASFPAETVVSTKAQAPGYRAESQQLMAHRKRNTTMDMETSLERIWRGL